MIAKRLSKKPTQGNIMRNRLLVIALAAIILFPATGFCAAPPPFYTIRVIDQATGRGIPGVELAATNAGLYYTDSAGIIAFNRPDLMSKKVYFFPTTPGYTFPLNGWFAGQEVTTNPGSSVTLRMTRDLAAQRMYRVTGPGVYRDSALLRLPVHDTQDVSDSPVMTQLSGDTILYSNRMFWLGNDTNFASSPNANRKGACATSLLPTSSSLDQEEGICLDYYRQDGPPKPAFEFGDGIYRGAGLRIVKNSSDVDVLCANYYRLNSSLAVLERGVAWFDETSSRFVKGGAYPSSSIIIPDGFSFPHSERGMNYIYSGSPWPNLRCLPEASASANNLAWYQSLTCLKAGSRLDYTADQMDREGGSLRWGWATNTSPVSEDECTSLVRKGLMTSEEQWYKLLDVDSSTASVKSGTGTVAFNSYRQRWISIRGEKDGKTARGETWYFEGDTNIGPWVYGRKIVTHYMSDSKTYSFLNPFHHAELDKDGGRRIFFDGTFTTDQGKATFAIPRYSGNRMMYMLDLADPRLVLPVPVYRVGGVHRTKKDIAETATGARASVLCARPAVNGYDSFWQIDTRIRVPRPRSRYCGPLAELGFANRTARSGGFSGGATGRDVRLDFEPRAHRSSV